MKPLPLHGFAASIHTVNAETAALFRLRSPQSTPSGDRDAALVSREDELLLARSNGFKSAIIFGDEPRSCAGDAFETVAALDQQFSYLADGDVVSLSGKTRRLRVLYRKNSKHNSFLVTDQCNHYCLMCSQPPKEIDDEWILDEIAQAIELIDPASPTIGFTGGEPLFRWRKLVDVLQRTREALPRTSIHVLSNGRAFSNEEVATAWAALRHPALTAGIPIYSSVGYIHDYVVQARGAFDETVLGVLRLKDKGQRVELRCVLHAITAPRLRQTCEWFARNLTFVDHVALMGLENTGFALANQERLWIDPVDYSNELTESVQILRSAAMRVSIYNLPLCLLDRSIWDVAVRSISDWKNDYLPACDACLVRHQCAGFFSTGRPRTSRAIRPILHARADNSPTLRMS